MPKVVFLPSGDCAQVSVGTTILEAARSIGVLIEAPCNGAVVCGKCKVRIQRGANTGIRHTGGHLLDNDEQEQGFVLACGAAVTDDVTVTLPGENQDHSTEILNQGKIFDVAIRPVISKQYNSCLNITLVYAGGELIGEEQGNTATQTYGVVVDIGTTTLVASLVELASGDEAATVSSVNPQAAHGQDVLSRIKIASESTGLDLLHRLIADEINGMISSLCVQSSIPKTSIYEVVLSGNTTMLHLAVGADPSSLGKYPYILSVQGGESHEAEEKGIHISSFGRIYLTPVISAYVGGDITSGILASQLHRQQGLTLFVDIGTNGEMVISNNGQLSATSTAAGPAFEGMNIKFGMRASSGAIEYFDLSDTGEAVVKTIHDEKPVGICGSGLIDIAGELVHHRIIASNGRFVRPEQLPQQWRDRIVEKDGKPVFLIADEIYLTQKDIRQVQLAKGAVRAGVEFLMRSMGVGAADIDRVYIAGSFGYHLQAKSLIHIGLLPSEFEGKIDFIGNTSKSGGHAFLINGDYRDQMLEVVKDVEVIELSGYKDFDKVFVECLSF